MNVTVFRAGIVLCALTFVLATGEVSAADVNNNKFELPTDLLSQQIALNNSGFDQVDQLVMTASQPDKSDKIEKPQPVKYKVKVGDNLSNIAKANNTTWERLFHKNLAIEHPDIIKVGDELIVPAADEKLKERQMPPVVSLEPTPAVAEPSRQQSASAVRSSQASSSSNRRSSTSLKQPVARGSSSGNRYVRGYCTWYVKNRRPDLPNNLGNANTWVARARAQGLATGSTPRVGAVGQQGMHVVYVEKVHANGTVTVSEMNFRGWNVVSSRTVPASNFHYIY